MNIFLFNCLVPSSTKFIKFIFCSFNFHFLFINFCLASLESLDDLMNNLNSTLGSEEGRMFSLSLRGNREILGRSLINLVKSWEK